jgi:hypothetical protein
MGSPGYYCYEEQPLTFVEPYDFHDIASEYPSSSAHFRIFFNIGVAWEEFPLVYTERTTDAYWSPNSDACYNDCYYDNGWVQDDDCGSGNYGWHLDVLGDWADGYRPQTLRVTCDQAYITSIYVFGSVQQIAAWTGTVQTIKEIDLCNYNNGDIIGIKVDGMWGLGPTKLIKIEFGEEAW